MPNMPKKYSFEACIASVLFIILFMVIILQILGRTAIITGPVWTEELARWLWVWMALIGIGAVELEGRHLRMGFIMELLPKKVQSVIAVITDLIYLALVLQLIWIAWKSVMRTWNNTSVTLPVTDAVLYASALVAMGLILHRILRRLFLRFHKSSAQEVSV
jgi:TRAP-type C4-dicarboxylate transport system permease small subunit